MIYSIGHSTKPLDIFTRELKSFNIPYLVDVRSKPYSRWNPQFNKKSLEATLKSQGITYGFLGRELGGKPDDQSCYRNGRIAYDLLRRKDFFHAGMDQLIQLQQQYGRIAIMCSEGKPQECHRTLLIGQALLERGISVQHIVSAGVVKSQEAVMIEATGGKGPRDLFGEVR